MPREVEDASQPRRSSAVGRRLAPLPLSMRENRQSPQKLPLHTNSTHILAAEAAASSQPHRTTSAPLGSIGGEGRTAGRPLYGNSHRLPPVPKPSKDYNAHHHSSLAFSTAAAGNTFASSSSTTINTRTSTAVTTPMQCAVLTGGTGARGVIQITSANLFSGERQRRRLSDPAKKDSSTTEDSSRGVSPSRLASTVPSRLGMAGPRSSPAESRLRAPSLPRAAVTQKGGASSFPTAHTQGPSHVPTTRTRPTEGSRDDDARRKSITRHDQIVRGGHPTTAAAPTATSASLLNARSRHASFAALLSMRSQHPQLQLPYAPHDMDVAHYADPHNWAKEDTLPPLVQSLLEGMSLELPYTSALWTQAYAEPAAVSQPPLNNLNGIAKEYLHREPKQRTNGFYSCVRCGTPITAPTYQVVPVDPSLRGIAAFDHLHLEGVEVIVTMPATDMTGITTPSGRRTAELDSTSKGRLCAHGDPRTHQPIPPAMVQRVRPAEKGTAAAEEAGLRFLVRCGHCHGCLGVVQMGEVAEAAAGDPQRADTAVEAATGLVTTVSRALFCANSVCMEYMPYETRAALDGVVVEEDGVECSEAKVEGAASSQLSSTCGSLSQVRQGEVAWGLGEAVAHRAASRACSHGVEEGDAKDDPYEASFQELLNELNPFSASMRSSGDSDG